MENTIQPDTLDAVASILPNAAQPRLEVQFVGGKLFLTEELAEGQAEEPVQLALDARTTWALLDYLYDRREALYRLASTEAENE